MCTSHGSRTGKDHPPLSLIIHVYHSYLLMLSLKLRFSSKFEAAPRGSTGQFQWNYEEGCDKYQGA